MEAKDVAEKKASSHEAKLRQTARAAALERLYALPGKSLVKYIPHEVKVPFRWEAYDIKTHSDIAR